MPTQARLATNLLGTQDGSPSTLKGSLLAGVPVPIHPYRAHGLWQWQYNPLNPLLTSAHLLQLQYFTGAVPEIGGNAEPVFTDKTRTTLWTGARCLGRRREPGKQPRGTNRTAPVDYQRGQGIRHAGPVSNEGGNFLTHGNHENNGVSGSGHSIDAAFLELDEPRQYHAPPDPTLCFQRAANYTRVAAFDAARGTSAGRQDGLGAV